MKKILISTIIILSALSLSSAQSITKNLKINDRNDEVKILQDFLIKVGHMKGEATGFYGRQTANAVRSYQKSINVSQTGNVGPATRNFLNKNFITLVATTSAKNITLKQEDVIDSIYDTNIKYDKDGRLINITQSPNYKSVMVVSAEMGGVKGFFYKNTKTFMTDFDLKDQAEKTEIERQKREGAYVDKSLTGYKSESSQNRISENSSKLNECVKRINSLIISSQQNMSQNEDRPIAMEFIRGQNIQESKDLRTRILEEVSAGVCKDYAAYVPVSLYTQPRTIECKSEPWGLSQYKITCI